MSEDLWGRTGEFVMFLSISSNANHLRLNINTYRLHDHFKLWFSFSNSVSNCAHELIATLWLGQKHFLELYQ